VSVAEESAAVEANEAVVASVSDATARTATAGDPAAVVASVAQNPVVSVAEN
jgi:phenylpyruvate tautomerase PptA (4-oxalocrotonate tautomerase family)